jgi:predicted pyridoxine 5'-phosphate oxidase superfamily flavin-nucleotide-binding protein
VVEGEGEVGTLTTEGFHEGELLVQHRAGVRDEASRLAGMLAAPRFSDGMRRFVADRDLIFITAHDAGGRLWTSPLYGRRGFCAAHDTTLIVSSRTSHGDPLQNLRPPQRIGAVLIDFGRRRRLRINGTLSRVGPHEIVIAADQVFGNCPQYIQQRELRPTGVDPDATADVRYPDELEPDHIAQIARADFFVLGTTHPTRGADTSHRGGAPGFVRVDGGRLWWPDYPGNNMFNSMGNLVEDPAAALLFIDFAAGSALQLSGHAEVEWIAPGAPGDDGGTGRRVRFTPHRVVSTKGLPRRLLDHLPYPRNPPLT